MVRTAIQLYTLRGIDAPLPAVLRRVRETDLDGVEFAGLDGAAATDVAAALTEAGLDVAAAHVDVDTLERDPGSVADRYGAVGCRDLVVPWLDADHFGAVRSVEAVADRLDDLADRLAGDGVRLHYHNHAQEFAEIDGRPALAHLVERTDRVRFELDAGWALAGGTDPVALLDRYGDRIDLLHVKDVDVAAERPVELGAGDLDVEAVVAAGRDAGVEWLIYEHDDPDDPEASLDRGAATLARLADD